MPKPRARRRKPTQPDEGTREEYLVAALRQLEAQVQAAEESRSWTAAVQAKAKALQVRAELDQLRETQQRQTMPASAAEHRAEVVSEVRRLRIGATEAGSYIAAAQLLRAELEILAQVQAADSKEDADELARKELEEIEAEIEELRRARKVH